MGNLKNKSLKELREEAGLLQKDVAEKLGISLSNYSKKENGIVKVSIVEANSLSKILKKDLSQIFLACEFQK